MDLDLAERFLTRVWERQPGHDQDGTHVFLAHKDWETGDWNNRSLPVGDRRVRRVLRQWECDVYFAPCTFETRKRQREVAIPGRWLYADLDEVDPANIELAPTLAWETSPGRFQALWLLDRAPKSVDLFEDLNRRLTYTVGADLGGWSTTKVLRVPGTVSTKYGRSRKKRFTVELVGKGGRYSLEELQRRLPQVDENGGGSHGGVAVDLAQLPDRKETLSAWRPRLPNRARTLLGRRHTVVGDDRSARLWELYALLLQAGMHPAEVLVAVQGTVWNKYAGQRRELAQLQKEISKAAAKHAQPGELDRVRPGKGRGKTLLGAVGRKLERDKEANPDKLQAVALGDFMRQQFPAVAWLVEDIWSERAYGLWAGEAKSYKTVMLLDLCLSVAGGGKFLDRFQATKGKAWYIHEEGRREFIHDRLHRILDHKGWGPKIHRNGGQTELELGRKLPMWVTSFAGIKFTDTDSQEKFVRTLDSLKPKLVVLETWYLLGEGIDENNANEVAPVLNWLGKVSRDFECSIILSHHYNKSSNAEQGAKRRSQDRVAGSSTFARWYESAVYAERAGDGTDHMATFQAEHREQIGSKKYTVQFTMDPDNEEDYRVEFSEDEEDETLPGFTPKQVAEAIELVLGGDPQAKVHEVIKRLKDQGWDAVSANKAIRKHGSYEVKKANVGQRGKEVWVVRRKKSK